MRMCIRARMIRLGKAEVYTHTRVVIRLYYIDREEKKTIANVCEESDGEHESVRV